MLVNPYLILLSLINSEFDYVVQIAIEDAKAVLCSLTFKCIYFDKFWQIYINGMKVFGNSISMLDKSQMSFEITLYLEITEANISVAILIEFQIGKFQH